MTAQSSLRPDDNIAFWGAHVAVPFHNVSRNHRVTCSA